MSLLRAIWSAVILGLVTLVGYLILASTGDVPTSAAPQPADPLATQAATTPAQDDAARVNAIERTWRNWMATQGVTKASLAIGFQGQVMRGAGIGIGPDDAVPVADLSKAITAICLTRFFDANAMSFNLTLGDLRDQLSEIRVLPPLWAQPITVAELMTHTSSLEPDVTKGDIWSRATSAEPRHRRIALAALAGPATKGERGRFFYNNGNYAVLGAVIEAMTGRPYEEVCRDEVLAPAGVTNASLSGPVASNSSFGGWSMSAEDYLRFIMHWTTPEQTWIAYPASYPQALIAAGSDARYGLGLIQEPFQDSVTFSHAGRYCLDDPAERQIGAGVITIPGEWAIVATWNTCTPEDKTLEFLRTLVEATR